MHRDIAILTLASFVAMPIRHLFMNLMYSIGFIYFDGASTLVIFYSVGFLGSIVSAILILTPFTYAVKKHSILRGVYFIIFFLVASLLRAFLFFDDITEYKEDTLWFFKSLSTWVFILTGFIIFAVCPPKKKDKKIGRLIQLTSSGVLMTIIIMIFIR